MQSVAIANTPQERALQLGISPQAMEIYLSCEVVDLHIDSFIWSRIFRYDLTRAHGPGLLGGRLLYQVDIPRVRAANVTGGVWSITTNPLWPHALRPWIFLRNLQRLKDILAQAPTEVTLVRNAAQFAQARAQGRHAAFIGVQGGNAVDAGFERLLHDDTVLRVTLVHLSTSSLGTTSSPLAGKDAGLTDKGRDLVRWLNHKRIFVDLAHVSRKGFFDAVEVHDRSLPIMVSHTGICGAHDHWRNLTDAQVRAVADSGGVIGIMYQSSFLGDPALGGRTQSIVRHMQHVVDLVGDDHVALGSDWDGMIVPPTDMPTCLELPRVAQRMLDVGWKPERIQKVLGGNFIRVLKLLRG